MGKLVLDIRVGGRVKIGKRVWLTLTQADRGGAKILFEAPLSIKIDREKIAIAKQREAKRR